MTEQRTDIFGEPVKSDEEVRLAKAEREAIARKWAKEEAERKAKIEVETEAGIFPQ